MNRMFKVGERIYRFLPPLEDPDIPSSWTIISGKITAVHRYEYTVAWDQENVDREYNTFFRDIEEHFDRSLTLAKATAKLIAEREYDKKLVAIEKAYKDHILEGAK